MSKDKNITLPPKPIKPPPAECCGRGCERCVYFYYDKALLRWQEKVKELKASVS